MKILDKHYTGLLARCNYGCGALLGYSPDEVDEHQTIICPVCNARLWVPFNPNYDGVIKEKEIKTDESTVV